MTDTEAKQSFDELTDKAYELILCAVGNHAIKQLIRIGDEIQRDGFGAKKCE